MLPERVLAAAADWHLLSLFTNQSVQTWIDAIVTQSRHQPGRSCNDAPKDFKDISDDVSRMHIVLKETDELVSDLYAQEPLDPEKLSRLQHLANVCRDVLSELEELLRKFGNLGSRNVGIFDRLQFAKDDVDALRDRIVANKCC
ncbi:hypothetical protein K440DRAFT_661532 [Wilcoxina mikolae CBS 423.85]|nr:hypothetical protein K440DRAFT_661532 [Wilcoxina mikolae CBS 423.85]